MVGHELAGRLGESRHETRDLTVGGFEIGRIGSGASGPVCPGVDLLESGADEPCCIGHAQRVHPYVWIKRACVSRLPNGCAERERLYGRADLEELDTVCDGGIENVREALLQPEPDGHYEICLLHGSRLLRRRLEFMRIGTNGDQHLDRRRISNDVGDEITHDAGGRNDADGPDRRPVAAVTGAAGRCSEYDGYQRHEHPHRPGPGPLHSPAPC